MVSIFFVTQINWWYSMDSVSKITGFSCFMIVRPDLFSVLAQQLQSADVLASHRIFMILFRTLKELSTKRLTADQRNFAEVCLLLCLRPLSISFLLLHEIIVGPEIVIFFVIVNDVVQFYLLADLVATLRFLLAPLANWCPDHSTWLFNNGSELWFK